MSEHIEKLRTEAKELEDKITKLDDFLHSGVVEVSDLHKEQMRYMRAYHTVLLDRIEKEA